MMHPTNQLPFGLLFAEPAPVVQPSPNLIYDEGESLSYVETPEGSLALYVENYLERTQTVTEVRREETDADLPMRTATESKVLQESTDSD